MGKLTHSGLNKMAKIMQTTIWNAFPWMGVHHILIEFWLSIGTGISMKQNRLHAIIWIKDSVVFISI